ncbi:MAG: hypothetical protein A3B74_01330 [Candidatus Kerfeldbacteria bacterium RIFCSPHIGHO2_02_FULL_42_14]|uniref:UDP-N-acetylmuramyl-tripeptide synthetase n=1 Tax=Candidatus Kerfeldbacteria bacterium RIFCSPHIGHO2_02_FULL_42_14 TaxID=1798540 RepID=A0A1G2AQC0_9BACT|nr:MAG: hypothetical protein A3B74_01330 [Candidatus Kerfeldbacteria bacterium RIFCSPHIGHO2_02_FULL_42_14]OGY81201.1 MAG: hypothetical protein A3E60_02845 [Candidatus Kerfeldbacteria bacterium RIFCSPHIGHO2_12_FULL_42_13]OGY83379.1 MAG: hypothetical protein A3I91_01865 [Candidatus Kerfeldbacteria bacterium RIFCSPLOWO2_02_FULL_42_19]OGY86359.1 MAG: hypothetical protein A3G01_05175 [Candidatus Kerfeldbacteria bacterium RIFCSPLOWO2_12_FULL_43_9]
MVFKELFKKIIPATILSAYHLMLAWVAAVWYRFPSRRLIVIGVTGTKGKSTTSFFITKLLETLGESVGLSGTIMFKVGRREWPNTLKMTMPGRFRLQRLLRDMVRAGCAFAVIETTSEGIAQHRHRGIDYDVLVFTNLSPEHIERHGSFEAYKRAKQSLFQNLHRSFHKNLFFHKQVRRILKVIVVNRDDPHFAGFVQFSADQHVAVSLCDTAAAIFARDVISNDSGNTFTVADQHFTLSLLGDFNVMNALLTLAVGAVFDFSLEHMRLALAKLPQIPGRMQRIDGGQDFTVIVDYAHEPKSMEALFRNAKRLRKNPQSRIITLISSTGGGRDVARRPMLGKLAGGYADIVIVTDEDPYDEDPNVIMQAVARGVVEAGKILGQTFFIFQDRKEAIFEAIRLARSGDVVLLPAKGSERVMAVAHNTHIPWSDEAIAREALKK